jgi:beta-fructofuranosidase
MALFYQPASAWAADFIPFYRDGVFHLFYLQDWRDSAGHGEGTPWYQISTRDFLHFTEHGEMLARGTRAEQDLYVFTGSVLEAQPAKAAGLRCDSCGRYHIFYTGHNPHFRQAGRPEQGVMHAVSDDLLTWRKLPEHTFFAPAAGYEPHDWRDPFVFWNEASGEYWMLLAARHTEGPSRRRGCTALCASKDLLTWEVREPFYDPGLYFTHECPDLFQMGDWWYLLFSEFSEKCVTRYRMSRSLSGPWLAPACDTFDSRVHYAAKSTSDGQRRFLFGWNATRQGEKDDGAWQWGGSLVVHELFQRPDGSLGVRLPETVRAAFAPAVEKGSAHLRAPGGFAVHTAGELPGDRRTAVLLDADLTCQPGTCAFGLFLRGSADFEQAYYLRFEPGSQRLVFDRWPRPGDQPFQPESERPLAITPGVPLRVQVILEGTLVEVYVAGEVALSYRLYELEGRQWGAFVQDGEVFFNY